MASRATGWKAPKSGVGFPHGKDKAVERRERAYARGGKRPKGSVEKPIAPR
jgi:hypothetical protein